MLNKRLKQRTRKRKSLTLGRRRHALLRVATAGRSRPVRMYYGAAFFCSSARVSIAAGPNGRPVQCLESPGRSTVKGLHLEDLVTAVVADQDDHRVRNPATK
jgi:hypothetical protein